MAAPTDPTPEVAGARRYSARVRIAIALAGGLLLAVDPALTAAPVAAAIGFAVIGATGVVELFVHDERWLAHRGGALLRGGDLHGRLERAGRSTS